MTKDRFPLSFFTPRSMSYEETVKMHRKVNDGHDIDPPRLLGMGPWLDHVVIAFTDDAGLVYHGFVVVPKGCRLELYAVSPVPPEGGGS